MTDIKDPKIDEMPPPYECSTCGFSTWSWNEAKKHVCLSLSKQAKTESGMLGETAEAAPRILHGVAGPAALKTLMELLEKARQGPTGEFRESTVELFSEPGRPVSIRVKRGPANNQGPGENPSFSVVLEIFQEE